LHTCMFFERYDFELVKMLISPEIINSKNNDGRSPLHIASSGSCPVEIARLLVDSGANPNSKDKHGSTALHRAANRKILNKDLLTYLFEIGDPFKMNVDRISPIIIIARNAWPQKEPETIEEEKATEFLRDLFNKTLEKAKFHPFGEPNVEKKKLVKVERGKPEYPFILQIAEESSQGALNAVLNEFVLQVYNSSKQVVTVFQLSKPKWGVDFWKGTDRLYFLLLLGSANKLLLSSPLFRAIVDQIFYKYVIRSLLTRLVSFLLLVICISVQINLEPSFGAQIISGFIVVLCVFHLYLEFGDAKTEGIIAFSFLKRKLLIPAYFTEFWNYFDILFYFYMIYISVIFLSDRNFGFVNDSLLRSWQLQIFALSALYMWSKVFEYSRMSNWIGKPLVLAFTMGIELARFMPVLLLSLLGFSHAFYLAIGTISPNYSTVPDALMTLFLSFMGDNDYQEIERSASPLAYIFFILFSLIGYVLLFNLLIAIMSNAYSGVQENVNIKLTLERASMVHRYLLRSSSKTWDSVKKHVLFAFDEGIPGLYLSIVSKEDWKQDIYSKGHIRSIESTATVEESVEIAILKSVKRIEKNLKYHINKMDTKLHAMDKRLFKTEEILSEIIENNSNHLVRSKAQIPLVRQQEE